MPQLVDPAPDQGIEFTARIRVHMLAVLNSLVLSLMDVHQASRQIRRFASHPDEALAWATHV